MGFSTMNNQGQIILLGPHNLLFESIQLLIAKGFVPIKIESDLTNCYIWIGSLELFMHLCEYNLIIVANIFRMQPYHGEAIVWILTTQVEHRSNGFGIDVGQEYHFHSCLTSSRYDLFAVFIELGFVYMAVGVDQS